MRSDATRLVASREIRLRIRSRAFVVSTLILMAGVVALVVLTAVLQRGDDRRHTKVAVVDALPALRQTLVDTGDALNTDVIVVALPDRTTAERQVRDGDVDLALVGSDVIWKDDTDDIDAAIVRSAAQAATTHARADQLGVGDQQLAELLQPVALDDVVLEPQNGDRGVRIGTATIGVILLFLAIQTYGNMVLMGVVEEKSSRVVEVLLSHVRPRRLLAGKILGIGSLGLLQLVLVVASALVALAAVHGIDVPNVPVDALIWFVVWFLLGFGLYATAYAMGGSLVSRQEDAASVVTPISIPFIASYLASFAIAGSPDSTFATIVSLVPITAPMTMPVRIAAGHPPAFQVALSVVLTALAIYVLVVVAGRVYSRNVLRTGSRVPWKVALRAAREPEE